MNHRWFFCCGGKIWMYLNDLPEELSFPFPARR